MMKKAGSKTAEFLKELKSLFKKYGVKINFADFAIINEFNERIVQFVSEDELIHTGDIRTILGITSCKNSNPAK